jgi:alanyl-tRNA synthetase
LLSNHLFHISTQQILLLTFFKEVICPHTAVVWLNHDGVAKGAHAGNLLREVAKIAGGGGGGQAAFATAGGRDATKVDDALSAAGELLGSQLP